MICLYVAMKKEKWKACFSSGCMSGHSSCREQPIIMLCFSAKALACTQPWSATIWALAAQSCGKGRAKGEAAKRPQSRNALEQSKSRDRLCDGALQMEQDPSGNPFILCAMPGEHPQRCWALMSSYLYPTCPNFGRMGDHWETWEKCTKEV